MLTCEANFEGPEIEDKPRRGGGASAPASEDRGRKSTPRANFRRPSLKLTKGGEGVAANATRGWHRYVSFAPKSDLVPIVSLCATSFMDCMSAVRIGGKMRVKLHMMCNTSVADKMLKHITHRVQPTTAYVPNPSSGDEVRASLGSSPSLLPLQPRCSAPGGNPRDPSVIPILELTPPPPRLPHPHQTGGGPRTRGNGGVGYNASL
jgi:hypothetical protein